MITILLTSVLLSRETTTTERIRLARTLKRTRSTDNTRVLLYDQMCVGRERNNGLFTADQNLNRADARATRRIPTEIVMDSSVLRREITILTGPRLRGEMLLFLPVTPHGVPTSRSRVRTTRINSCVLEEVTVVSPSYSKRVSRTVELGHESTTLD